MERSLAFQVSQEEMGRRLDRFLQQQGLSLSRSRIKQLIEAGLVLVNDRRVKAGTRVKPGDRVACMLPAPRPLEAKPEEIPLDILYEDSDIVVVNKAPGMVVHPAPRVFSGTLVNALLFHCEDLSGINGVLRPGIVHRLDRHTSGVIVAAKNDSAHESLARQFKGRLVEKRYLAVVCGHPSEQEGLITASLGRHPSKRGIFSIHTRKPRDALTRWRVVEVLRYFTVLEIFPRTGRTHQIRVHLSSTGHPILGDPVYCRKRYLRRIEDPEIRKIAEGVRRQALHASRLRIFHPRSGEPMEFHAPLARDMEELIEALRG
ncbi:MAG: RluA family pseudouridine synthase [Deltaproteobacteria bacterium]|nr:RluA family pseudouridine synthase [Deltaproteobacteria bacterium]